MRLSVPSVAICTPTFRRPHSLARLLESLTQVDSRDASLTVIVVDNDANESARATVDGYRDRLPGLVYAVEREVGISAARNRLVDIALEARVDFICFVDDDEWVDPQWVQHLLATARTFAADVVIGPVIASYEEATARWLRQGGFFDRPRFATGTPIGVARTGNALVSAGLFVAYAENFPRSLPIAEDTYFFERVLRSGASIVWCDEAVVYEHVPMERARVGWLLRRAFRQGETYSQCLVLLGQSRRQRTARVGHCLVRLGQGSLLALPSVFLGRAAVLRSVRQALGGAGGLLGVVRATHRASSHGP